MNLQKISNQDLYKFCQTVGCNSRKWMRKFAYALPEVERRQLFRRYQFESIYVFASKLAGMNFKVAKNVLRLGDQFKNMPLVWEQMISQGWSKLRVIAAVVNQDNQHIWIENLNRCTKKGLEKLVSAYREWEEEQMRRYTSKMKNGEDSKSGISDADKMKRGENAKNEASDAEENQERDEEIISKTGQVFPGDDVKNGVVAYSNSNTQMELLLGEQLSDESDQQEKREITWLKLMIDEETKFQFKKFKQKIEKERGGAMTGGEVFKILLERADLEQGINKERVVSERKAVNKGESTNKSRNESEHESKNESKNKSESTFNTKIIIVGRYIAIAKRRKTLAEQNERCKVANCKKPIHEFHHPKRFSLNQSHEDLVGLCKVHHLLAHAGYIDEKEWQLSWKKSERELAIEYVDERVRSYWKMGY